MGFVEEVKAGVEMLGGREDEAVVDFLADPGGACGALDAIEEHAGIIVRVAPELGKAASGYGPAPADPRWIRVMRGAREISEAALRGGDGRVRRAVRVEIEEREIPCCEAPGCDRKKLYAAAWIVVAGAEKRAPDERLLAAEERVERAGEGRAPDTTRAVGAKLSRALGVPLERGGEEVSIDAADPGVIEAIGVELDAPSLARLAMRTEGDRVVLRDLASRGPRATAARNAWIGAALMGVAAVLWFQLWRAWSSGAGTGTMIGFGAGAALFTLAGYAFIGVARFASKYNARSGPLVAVGLDRLVVLPWVGRDGAVDVRPEGRLGAAIPLGEVRAARPVKRGEAWAVEVDTDHGMIDAIVAESEPAAAMWSAALNRAVDEARHPKKGASARQRARARAEARAEDH